ncbi:hypothetical protein Bca4012_065559 [Brassica carinata]|uniref:RNase H type-1 domain-containing protein n=1 Tax=Brassica carinata TaxID=52824 RepID=A0A8X7VP11_BRACI|nr:hypothetical protein Bca52824_017871 [Brassica carinata]
MDEESFPVSFRRKIPWYIWTIWKNRNQVLYTNTQNSLLIQIKQAEEEARVWNELNVSQQNMELGNGLVNEDKRWDSPTEGTAKCNIHANWRNARLHSGGFFFICDHRGNVLHHARGAFTFSPNRLTTELRCLE